MGVLLPAQGFWGLDVTVFVGLVLGLVAMASGRLAVGVVEPVDVPAMLVGALFLGCVCAAGELQAQGGEALLAALAALPWDEWPAAERRRLAALLAFTQRHAQVGPHLKNYSQYQGGQLQKSLVVGETSNCGRINSEILLN